MSEIKTEKIRNIVFCGGRGSGKTQLCEAILFKTGLGSRMNLVEKGNSIMDANEDEIEKKMTLTMSLAQINWKDTKINIIDTPGEVDFLGDIITGIYYSDVTCLVISSEEGIVVGTYKAWEYVQKFKKPVFIFINKIDKKKDITELVNKIKEEISINAAPLLIPDGDKIKDILREGSGTEVDALIEVIASSEDSLTEKYLESGKLEENDIKEGLKKGILTGKIIPILSGSALEVKGVDELLDFIVDKLPSPKEIDDNIDESKEFKAQVFKIMFESHMGEIVYFKVFSGILKHGEDVINLNNDATERMGQLYFPVGKKNRTETKVVVAGDIACALKLKNTSTFDTFSKKKSVEPFPKLEFPSPVVWMAVYAKDKGEEEKVANSISALLREDPTLKFGFNPEIREMILEGLGNTQLEVMVKRAQNRFSANLELRKPRIPYKETIRGTTEVQGKYKRQSGGRGQYGDVWIKLEPKPRGEGYEFVNKIVGGRIPSNYIPAIEKGIKSAMDDGVIAGYPVIDMRVTLYDGSFHEVDSSNIAFEIASRMALKKGVEQASPWILEPIMDVEVIVPEEYTGSIMGDLNGRRGRVLGMDRVGKKQIIKAQVPQAELFTYAQDLRSMTRGQGEFKMKFSHYEEAPGNICDSLIKEFQRQKDEKE